MTTPQQEREKELRIGFKKLLLEHGIALVDLSEYSEKAIANYWLTRLAQREAEIREAVEGMNEQNQITQAILGALEYRGFYDAGKYLDGSVWERVKPEIINLLTPSE